MRGKGEGTIGEEGGEDQLLLKHRMLLEIECDEVEDGKGIETSMKGFAIKASMSEMVSLGEGGEKTVGVNIFLKGGCREEVLVIKDEVGSIDGFGEEAQERYLAFCV